MTLRLTRFSNVNFYSLLVHRDQLQGRSGRNSRDSSQEVHRQPDVRIQNRRRQRLQSSGKKLDRFIIKHFYYVLL